jgi:glucosylceramidase
LPKWPKVVLSDPQAAQYVDGIAIHWYESLDDTVTWFWKPFKNIKDTLKQFPNKFVFGSEACIGDIPTIPFLFTRGPLLGDWGRGETYAYDIINDLNAGVVGWTDWNLSLDLTGGPNWAANNVDSPILIDTDSKDIYYKQPMFFFLSHFSHFVLSGSKRVTTSWVNQAFWNKIGLSFEPQIISFKRKDKKLVVIILNYHFWQKEYELKISEKKVFKGKIASHSIQTLIFKI